MERYMRYYTEWFPTGHMFEIKDNKIKGYDVGEDRSDIDSYDFLSPKEAMEMLLVVVKEYLATMKHDLSPYSIATTNKFINSVEYELEWSY